MTLPGGSEWIIILLILLLLFGGKKLPGLASSMGASIKEFRKATNEPLDDAEVDAEADATAERDRDA